MDASKEITVKVPARVAEMLDKIRNYEHRDIPENLRISLVSFTELFIQDAALKGSAYVQKQAELKVEKLIQKLAVQQNITFAAAYEKVLGKPFQPSK
jgi:hypothetical protein